MPSAIIKQQALKILDGIEEITKAEMLVSGQYIDREITNPERIDSLCGGRRVCLMGSAWLAAGYKADFKLHSVVYPLPGIDPDVRAEFLARRPGLRLAYDALNQAAESRIKRLPPDIRDFINNQITEGEFAGSAAENLFENSTLDRKAVLSLLRSARKIIEAAT